jgi:hypothetical protein
MVVKVTGPAVSNVANFTITGTTGGYALVYPQGQSALGPGTFSSTITVIACTTDPNCTSSQLGGSPATINVTYTIYGVKSSETNLNYAIGNATPTSSDLTHTFSVTGYPVQTFTTASDASWLSVTPQSGSTSASTSVSAALVPGELDHLDSGHYTANVTLTPTSGTPVVVPVILNVTRTQVNYASPYVQTSGVQDDVIIRGENFSLIHPTAVQFGTTPATTFTVVSDTEIHATHPPLAAGTYSVHVSNQEGIDRTRAQLVVVDAPTYAAAALAYPSSGDVRSVVDLVYDAGRGAVLVAMMHPSRGANWTEIYRFAYSAGSASWSSAVLTTLPGISAMALTANGGKLLVGTQDQTNGFDSNIIEADPITIATLLTTSVLNFGPPTHIALVNDGRAIMTGGINAIQSIMSYSELRPQVVPLNPQPNGASAVYNGAVAASGDGSSAEISDGLDGEVALWNASTEQLTSGHQSHNFAEIKLNRDGSRVLRFTGLNGAQVYDTSQNLLGTLPTTTVVGVLAPSGLRAYTYDSNGTIRVFDLTTPPADGQSLYPEILPAIIPSASPSSSPNTVAKMVISPDGGRLFVAGDQQVVVVPVQ